MSRLQRPRLVIIGVCLLIATMTLPPVVAGAAGSATSSSGEALSLTDATDSDAEEEGSIEPRPAQVSAAVAEERVVPTTLEVERLDGTGKIQFRYTFDLPNDTTQFEILSTSQDDGYSITATTGFTEGQQLTWDGKTATPSLTLEYTLPNDSNAGLQRVRTPFVGGQIERGDPPEGSHVDMVYKEPVSFHLDTTVEVAGEGRYVAGTVVLGSYTTYTGTSYGQEITLFVPDGVDMAVSPEDAVTALVATERTIQGDPHRDTYVFVQEGQIAVGGAGSTTARVFAGSDLEVYIHEQAHLNEVAYYDRKMGWFTEASATYYGSDFYIVDGELRIMPAKLLERTDPDTKWPRGDHHNDSVLAEPSTWESKTDYQKGSRLLFALDAKLRAATDGDATIHDLMRRVNEEGGYRALNYTEFRGIVVDLAGEQTGSWLDPYVLTSQNPPQPNASAFGPTPTFANGTTNTSGDPGETFELSINIPSDDPHGIESATLAIDADGTTVEAAVSDGNDDGRVDVRFQPYGPDGGSVLEPADSADEVTVTSGTLEAPVGARVIEIALLVTDPSGRYTISTRAIELESTPTAQGTPTERTNVREGSDLVPGVNTGQVLDRITAVVSNLSSNLSTLELVIGIPLVLVGFFLMTRGE